MGELKVLLFAGTSEGRELSGFLNDLKIPSLLSVATDYGEEILEPLEYVTVRSGRLDLEGIRDLCKGFSLVIDATHPYALEASSNIRKAAEKEGVTYLRLLRDRVSFDEEEVEAVFDSVKDAACYLKDKEGKIFISTGSKELEKFDLIPDHRERLVVRVLPVKDSLDKAEALGIRTVIRGKGPFSYEENLKHFKESGASYLVTKESGSKGGFREKLEAAAALGIRVILIRRPAEEGFSMEEIKEYLINRKDGQ